VALKILLLPWQLSEAERATFQARFRREAETLQRLRHPHILRLLDFGEAKGLAYLVLPYLEVAPWPHAWRSRVDRCRSLRSRPL
jgi:serine/threonine-protein kinase